MSMKAIANEDCKIKFTPTVVPPVPPDAVYAADIAYNKTGSAFTLSPKVKCKGKQSLTTALTFTWAVGSAPCPFTSSLYTFVSGAGSIAATSTKVKCEANPPLREEDSGTCVGSWTLTAPPKTVLVCSCACKISKAGQDKVLSN